MPDKEPQRVLVVTWPLAVVLIALSICATILSLAGILPRELVAGWVGLLIGAAVPTQPIVTRWKTVYSEFPPPHVVESDRPEPGSGGGV